MTTPTVGPNPGKYAFQGYVLDVGARSISLGQTPIALRRKAFEVLACLFASRDRAVAKDELIQAVWGGASVSDDVLTSTIHAIRSSLGDDSHTQAVIKTIHGFGYQFVAAVQPFTEPAVPETPARPSRRRRLYPWIGVAAILPVISLGGFRFGRQAIASISGSEAPPVEVAWLRFEEQAGAAVVDSSGHGNHARIVNGVVRAAGVLGSGLEFDGLGGYLVGNSSGHDFPAGDAPRSVVCWVRTSDRTVGDRNLLHWGTPVPTPPRLNYHLFLSAGRVGWGNGYGQGFLRTTGDVADGRWHQVAAVFTGAPQDISYLYIDGRQVEAAGPHPADTRPKANWTIGLFMGGGKPYRGALDDMRVYVGALSPSSILALYHCAQPEPAIPTPLAGRLYFVPVGDSELTLGTRGPSDTSAPLENHKEFFGAAQFAVSDGSCRWGALRGTPLPSPVRISMDVELPPMAADNGENLAGPFFDSPPLGPFDRLMQAPGVWIALGRDGRVTVRPLASRGQILAASPALASWDALAVHHLVVERLPRTVRVAVDGAAVMTLPLAADATKPTGGIAFQMPDKPIDTAPQRIRNLTIERM